MNEEQFVIEMCDALNEGMKVADDFCEAFERIYELEFQELKLKIAEKYVFYVTHYAEASVLMRWYWKRKIKKFTKGLKTLKEEMNGRKTVQ